jgi:hypothetical protein
MEFFTPNTARFLKLHVGQYFSFATTHIM